LEKKVGFTASPKASQTTREREKKRRKKRVAKSKGNAQGHVRETLPEKGGKERNNSSVKEKIGRRFVVGSACVNTSETRFVGGLRLDTNYVSVRSPIVVRKIKKTSLIIRGKKRDGIQLKETKKFHTKPEEQ